MGEAVDLYGRVTRDPTSWTAPASPAPRALHPSYTIAALAEHSMETIVRRDVGRVF